MLHIVILVAWYVCNPRQQRLAWYYSSSSTAVVPLLCETLYYWCTTRRELPNHLPQETAAPPPHCVHAWTCSWYLLLVYTRYYSNLTAVLCTGILPCSLIRTTTTDFRISRYSSTHISYFVLRYFLFSRGCQAFHLIYIYQTYYTAVYVAPWYQTT